MDRILLDASTVVFVADLLAGRRPLSAVNVFDLAVLVESLILHDQLIVLNTYDAAAAETATINDATATFGDAMHVLQKSARDVVSEYVDARLSPGYIESKKRGGFTDYYARYDFHSVSERVSNDLLGGSLSSTEIQEYRQLLEELLPSSLFEEERSRSRPALISRPQGKAERLLRRVPGIRWIYVIKDIIQAPIELDFSDFNFFGPKRHPLNEYFGAGDVLSAYADVQRDGDPTGGSAFAAWYASARPSYEHFARGLVARTGLYLIASDLFGAPYRSDSLRRPICWRYFKKNNDGKRVDLRSACVSMAEDFYAKELNTINQFMGLDAIAVNMPLFLHAVLKESNAITDIVKVALQIRESDKARRFREFAKQLNSSLADGELGAVVRGIKEYSRFLTQQFGSSEPDVVLALLSGGSSKFDAAGIASSFSVKPTDVAWKLGSGIVSLWKGRRFAIISTVLKQAKKARAFNVELQRLFGDRLSDENLRLLSRLEQYDRAAS